MNYLDDVDVRLIEHMGSDRMVIAAAKVSTAGVESLAALDSADSVGLINYLMKNKHGTPFEHSVMTFFIKAPIFVFREFHRHRIGWSYNEESARYKDLAPDFYVPNNRRPGLMQVDGGRPGQYQYLDATPDQYDIIHDNLMDAYREAYATYQRMLRAGVAREVARMCLPVGIFSSMYATCNPRSLMSFLSLRTKRDQWDWDPETPDQNEGHAKHPSKPQWEINRVADLMELEFAKLFPLIYKAYCDNGRVAP